MKLMEVILIYILFINVYGLFIMYWDKRKAIKNQYRTTEFSLLLTGFIGGAIGVLVGMFLFRHKIQKLKFQVGVPVALLLNLYVFYLIRISIFPTS